MYVRVLIVDDEADLAETMATILEMNGFETVTVTDGADVVAAVVMEQPSLILLDVMLPHKTGWSLCKELQNNPLTASIPIVMVSARTNQQDVEKAIESGAKDYLIKPFMIDDLLEMVSRWIPVQEKMVTI